MATRFADHLISGVHASRPAATAVPAGTLYSCSTHGLIYQSDGATWATYATLGTTETLPVTILDAKGDLIAATAADTAAKVTVGTDGQVLTADAASGPGLKWATPAVGAAGAVTLLSTTTLSSAGTFDVSGISGSYNDLICVLIARDNATGGSVITPSMMFNGSAAANYYNERASIAGSSAVSGAEAIGATNLGIGRLPGTGGVANSFGVVEYTIFGYASTTWLKAVTVLSFTAGTLTTGNQNLQPAGGLWNSTAAITRVQIQGSAGANLVTGSQLRIYGRL